MQISKYTYFIYTALLVFSLSTGLNATAQDSSTAALHYLYPNGEAGYACFRIPALLTTNKGTLLAFAEARRNGCGDTGDIDLVVKRSHDSGKTWSALQVVWSDSANTCGNPVPIMDEQTGRIILLATWNLGTDHEKEIINQTSRDSRRAFVLSSADDGNSWSAAKEITASVKHADWTWFATGPCAGIQLQQHKYKGRLVVPGNFLEAVSRKNYSLVIYSDDHGDTWHTGGITPQDGVNESTVAELKNGSLLLNMRNTQHKGYRQVAYSHDGGMSWGNVQGDTVLKEPMCQGSLITLKAGSSKGSLLFANPANATERKGLTVRLGNNKGNSWVHQQLLYPGPSAYSALSVIPGGDIACLFEAGYKKPYEGIVYQALPLKQLEHAQQ
ncbi:sialidase family protein [Deminuibacter soli]|uniref:exo-alpha-sialidase n=1 Tax=Deminuibacter soli TaxID=2291815 RepID=A0A3E1NHX8_9BACT|nr:sialidase family protein [Deminuibacter soli]RFM27474.1 exo-alpha-sialidase [Deminuibacter soli]